MVRRALISVSDKRGVVELAKVLNELGVQILSTGGTASALASAPSTTSHAGVLRPSTIMWSP